MEAMRTKSSLIKGNYDFGFIEGEFKGREEGREEGVRLAASNCSAKDAHGNFCQSHRSIHEEISTLIPHALTKTP